MELQNLLCCIFACILLGAVASHNTRNGIYRPKQLSSKFQHYNKTPKQIPHRNKPRDTQHARKTGVAKKSLIKPVDIDLDTTRNSRLANGPMEEFRERSIFEPSYPTMHFPGRGNNLSPILNDRGRQNADNMWGGMEKIWPNPYYKLRGAPTDQQTLPLPKMD